MELLESLADAKNRDWNQELAKTLCQDKLGRLPLAITLVGCYLANDPGLTLESVINRLNHKGLAAKPLNPVDSTVAERGVNAAIELTYEVLEAECQDLAVFLSLFACAPLEWRLVESALGNIDPDDAEDQRGELLRYSLLDAKTIENTTIVGYQFHPLVWEFLRDKVNKRLDEQVIRDFVKGIVTEAETIEYNAPLADYEKVRPSIPHIEEVAEVWMNYVADEDITPFYEGVAVFYWSLVDYVQAETWLQENIELVKKRLPPNHSQLADSLNNLALLYEAQGKYSEAEPLYLEGLEINRQSLPSNHPRLATSLNNLAGLYKSQGKYSEAEPLYLEGLEIKRQSLPPNHPNLATSLNNLGLLYEAQGKYSEAEPLYLEGLEINRQSLPSNHPRLATSLNNLAGLYKSQGKYSEAEFLHLEGLEIKRQSLPSNHPSLATSLNNLGLLYKAQEKYTEAEPLYQEALEIDRQSLPPNHHDLAIDLNNLAKLYEVQEKYTEAVPLYVEAMEILREALGENHPNTQKVISNYEKMRSDQD